MHQLVCGWSDELRGEEAHRDTSRILHKSTRVWAELEVGDYDWAQQAMEWWPARVKAACQTNMSFAIAHGLA
jgi:hypothetical protein